MTDQNPEPPAQEALPAFASPGTPPNAHAAVRNGLKGFAAAAVAVGLLLLVTYTLASMRFELHSGAVPPRERAVEPHHAPLAPPARP